MTIIRPTSRRSALDRTNVRRHWRSASFVHWPVPLTEVAARLPAGLAVDTFDGHAWIGLIPRETSSTTLGSPSPWIGSFPETGLRTYVIGPQGPGLWIDSLDITRPLPAATARVLQGLPCSWAHMTVRRFGDVIEYELRRRWPEQNARSRIEIAVGNAIPDPDSFETWLTKRRRVYSVMRSGLASAAVDHQPLPLHAARLASIRDDLVGLAGYTRLAREPHVIFSQGAGFSVERRRLVEPIG